MSKFIKDHSLSVGYNNSGQEFFDIINNYKKYIHSYFLSLTEDMMLKSYNKEEVISTLKKCNTFDVPSNVLFNIKTNKENIIFILNEIKNIINLQGITLLDPSFAHDIKELFPQLEIHLSVRFFDWNSKSPNQLIDELKQNKYYDIIDVINISGSQSYTDHLLIKKIKDLGIQTKLIVNESCIVNRSENYRHFEGFETANCSFGKCDKKCKDIIKKYPWMVLSKINMLKEMIQYYDIDILKISSRTINNDLLKFLLDYWTSDDGTSINNPLANIDFSKNYDLFLQWIAIRSYCKNDCFNCRLCEKFYNEFLEL